MKQKPAIIEAEIGKRIKSLRKKKGITLEGLAAETGFTKGYLSKVEKSLKAPPVSTLGIIARALGTTISMLLGEDGSSSSPISIVRKDERLLITRAGTDFGYSYEAVAHKFANKMMEPFVLTLPIRPKKRTMFQHEGEEILFVLEGRTKFHYGSNEYIMEEGDCVYFDSGVPHLGESIGDKPVKTFMVIFNPTNR
jgi:transcriptional regulator with XRE-family HTH domain